MADGNVVVKLSALANTRQVDKFAGRLQKVDGVAKKLGRVLAGVFAVATIRKALGVADAYAQQENRLISLTGSLETARKVMEDLRLIAKKSAFTTAQMTDAFIALASNGLEPSVAMMEHLGQFASHAGSDIDAVGKALADAAMGNMGGLEALLGTKVQGSGDNLWVQIGDDIIETQNGVMGLMHQLHRVQGDDWAKAQERDVNTLKGALNKMKDSVEGAMEAFMAGFGGDLPGAVQKFSEAMETLKPVFTLMGKVVGSLLDPLLDGIDWLTDKIDGAGISFGQIEDFIAAIIVALGVLKVAALLGFAVFTWPVALIAAIAAGLFGLFKFFKTEKGKSFLEKSLERVRAMIASVKGAFADLGSWIKGIFDSVMSDVNATFGNSFRAIMALLKGDFSGFVDYMQAAVWGVFDFLLKQLNRVLGGIDKIAGFVGINTNLQGLTESMTGRPSAPSQTTSNVNSNVGKVEVNVTGSTNASAADVGRSVGKGVNDALRKQTGQLKHNYAET